MSRIAVLLAVLAVTCLLLLPTLTSAAGSSSRSKRFLTTPSPSIPDALQPYAPFYLPSAVVPGQVNYLNFTRPEGVREVYLYVPSGYNASVAWPFAFYFHGYGTGLPSIQGYAQGIYLNVSCTQHQRGLPTPPTPLPALSLTYLVLSLLRVRVLVLVQMTVDAEAAGYVIAFGQGTPSGAGYLSWDAGRCCKGYNSTMVKVDDVAYTRAAVALIESVVKVDPTRRYAMGWSNGGFQVEQLACLAHDLWAGICADASSVMIGPDATTGQRQCDTSFGTAHLDYIHFSGTADTAVPWTGSAYNNPQGTPSALDDIARWVERLGCPARFRQTFNDGIFSNLVWSECRGNATVEWMTVRNGQHQWWTRTIAPAFPFETTEYVLNFFTRTYHRRRAEMNL